jgi:hypothetical protein
VCHVSDLVEHSECSPDHLSRITGFRRVFFVNVELPFPAMAFGSYLDERDAHLRPDASFKRWSWRWLGRSADVVDDGISHGCFHFSNEH